MLRLSNLDKVLYPETGFTKRDVLDYYVAVAPVLLPLLARRPVTLRRYPDGADGEGFFEKHAARHAPDWVRTAWTPSKSGSIQYVLISELPELVWAANLAALELHVPQWTVEGERTTRRVPNLLVFDLDPGEPATVVECCRVAELIRAELAEDGLCGWPKTSGSKGMQVYAPVTVSKAVTSQEKATWDYAKSLAARLNARHGDLLVPTMTKAERTGKVYIDWSQNNPAKTTIAAYSLRARRTPTVSTPLTWDEVRACRTPADLTFTADDVRARIDSKGDLFADLHKAPAQLPRTRPTAG